MAVILLEKDPFVEAEVNTTAESLQTNDYNIRRPFYGISVKDPKHSYIGVQQDQGNGNLVPISMRDSSAPGGWSTANHNYILTAVTESRQEKVQIIETFGDHFAFFYGEKPIVLSCQGMLINTEDFNWKNEWFHNYNRFLRGTKCVENRARVFLGFDDVLVQGYILGCSVNYSADMPYVCPFSFSLLLAKEPLDLSPTGQEDPPSTASTNYVSRQEDARSTSDAEAAPFFVEYIGQPADNLRYAIDPITGDSVLAGDVGPNVPNAIDNPRSAFWLSEKDPRRRQWRNQDESLMELNTKITAQQSGSDVVTARQALRRDPAAFQLASRTPSTTAVSKSLSKGISNSAAVISDAPAVE